MRDQDKVSVRRGGKVHRAGVISDDDIEQRIDGIKMGQSELIENDRRRWKGFLDLMPQSGFLWPEEHKTSDSVEMFRQFRKFCKRPTTARMTGTGKQTDEFLATMPFNDRLGKCKILRRGRERESRLDVDPERTDHVDITHRGVLSSIFARWRDWKVCQSLYRPAFSVSVEPIFYSRRKPQNICLGQAVQIDDQIEIPPPYIHCQAEHLGYGSQFIAITKSDAVDRNVFVGHVPKFYYRGRRFAVHHGDSGIGKPFSDGEQRGQAHYDVA